MCKEKKENKRMATITVVAHREKLMKFSYLSRDLKDECDGWSPYNTRSYCVYAS